MIIKLIVWFQKLSIPPPRRGFFLRPPPPPSVGKYQSRSTHLLKYFFGSLRPPPPHHPGISNSFCGGTMDIFRNYTFPSALHLLVMIIKEENWFCPLPGLECWKKVISFQNGASWICSQRGICLSGLTNKHMNEFEIGPWVWNTFTCINITLGGKSDTVIIK